MQTESIDVSVTHMSPSWTRIRVQTRFYRVHTMYTRVPIGNLVAVGLYVVLLVKLGDLPPYTLIMSQDLTWANLGMSTM